MAQIAAVDLGAESGRVIRATVTETRITLEETGRFRTGGLPLRNHLHWNIFRIYEEILEGLTRAASEPLDSIGVDSWGVDFSLLDPHGNLCGVPFCYRDPRTERMPDALFPRISREKIYERTGIQFLSFNTLCQLAVMAEEKSPALACASDLLMIADTFHYFLTGVRSIEYTNATTTQLWNLSEQTWDTTLFAAAGIDPDLPAPVVHPGAELGPVTGDGLDALSGISVITPPTHDTASAVAAVPAEGEGWAYLSSGTWSLMGIESPTPINSAAALAANLTNEGGIDGTYRVLRNIMGLWLVQRLRADLGLDESYAEITAKAAGEPALATVIDVTDNRLLNPPNMPGMIATLARESGQPVPATPHALVRCALESLALEYRHTLETLQTVTGQAIDRIHIVGGGSQNRLLNQFTADASGLPVIAGPAEATALGNIVVQARTLGILRNHETARRLIAASFPPETFRPHDPEAWHTAYTHYCECKEKTR